MYASQRSTGICSMLYPRVILAVSLTPWTIILVGVKFLTLQPKAEHIRKGILFIEDPFSKNAPVRGESQSSHQHWNIKWSVMERRSNWVDEVVV